MVTVAALFVAARGCYYGVPGVEPWGLPDRDALLYAGPWPVVAHPECKRWGRFSDGGRSAAVKVKAGDDGGVFEAAFNAVRKWGGVLEHPADSKAWRAFKIAPPPRAGGWVSTADGWSCCVEQGHYGHRAQKPTWLYVVGAVPPALRWGSSAATVRVGRYALPTDPDERRRAVRTGIVQRLSHNQRRATPIPFRDLLISIARSTREGG